MFSRLHGSCVYFAGRRRLSFIVAVNALNDSLAHVDQTFDLWTWALERHHPTQFVNCLTIRSVSLGLVIVGVHVCMTITLGEENWKNTGVE